MQASTDYKTLSWKTKIINHMGKRSSYLFLNLVFPNSGFLSPIIPLSLTIWKTKKEKKKKKEPYNSKIS